MTTESHAHEFRHQPEDGDLDGTVGLLRKLHHAGDLTPDAEDPRVHIRTS